MKEIKYRGKAEMEQEKLDKLDKLGRFKNDKSKYCR